MNDKNPRANLFRKSLTCSVEGVKITQHEKKERDLKLRKIKKTNICYKAYSNELCLCLLGVILTDAYRISERPEGVCGKQLSFISAI